MTDKLREAAQAAYDYITSEGKVYPAHLEQALESALAEPEQEPVAWYHNDFGVLEFSLHERVGWSPLYAAPPRREWVGLTDDEIDKWNIVGHESLREFVRSLEAKLKEKNT